ncbi:hypothetical protein AGMMS50249_2350 [candidate division SR1 bacterium]|nr:hypothetical protein AGMMS50249_2350 [candidate division SR1 bacterium]
MQNLYLFTGENRYELYGEVQRRKLNFSQKFGADAVLLFHQENRNLGVIQQSLQGGGLFITKKIIFLEGLPVSTEKGGLKADQYEPLTDYLMKLKEGGLADTILVFISEKPDKRGKLYKWLTKEAQIKEFGMHNKSGLKSFIKKEAVDLGMTDDVIGALIDKVGTDQFRLMSELEKLRYFKKSSNANITISDIENVCYGGVETNGFAFFDHLLSDPMQAIHILDSIQSDGSDRNQTSGMLFWGLRNYLIVLGLDSQGRCDGSTLASEGKMAPFAASKLISNLNLIRQKSGYLTNFFTKMVEMDYDLKQGILPPERFWLGVKRLVLAN